MVEMVYATVTRFGKTCGYVIYGEWRHLLFVAGFEDGASALVRCCATHFAKNWSVGLEGRKETNRSGEHEVW